MDTATGRVLGYVRILDRVNKLRERERPKEWQEFVAFVVHGDSVRYLKTLQSLQEARSVWKPPSTASPPSRPPADWISRGAA